MSYFSELPNELLYEISEHLHSQEDFNAFLRCSRKLHRIFNKCLYRHDIKHHKSSALIWAASNGNVSTAKRSLEERSRSLDRSRGLQDAFALAVEHGHHALVVVLVEHGADVNAPHDYFGSALQAASWSGDYQMMELLLDRGADINAQGGHYGTALQATAWTANEETVRLLLKRKADVNLQGGYFSNALQGASWAGNQRIVEVLLSYGAHINIQGGFYGNALQAASWRGHKQVVKMLIRAGANVDARGGQYNSAYRAALMGGHRRVAGLLQFWSWCNYWTEILSRMVGALNRRI